MRFEFIGHVERRDACKNPRQRPLCCVFHFSLAKVEHTSAIGRHQSIPIRLFSLSLCRTCSRNKNASYILFVSYRRRILPVCRRTPPQVRGCCIDRSLSSTTSVTSRRAQSRDRYTKEHFYSRALGLFGLDER